MKDMRKFWAAAAGFAAGTLALTVFTLWPRAARQTSSGFGAFRSDVSHLRVLTDLSDKNHCEFSGPDGANAFVVLRPFSAEDGGIVFQKNQWYFGKNIKPKDADFFKRMVIGNTLPGGVILSGRIGIWSAEENGANGAAKILQGVVSVKDAKEIVKTVQRPLFDACRDYTQKLGNGQ